MRNACHLQIITRLFQYLFHPPSPNTKIIYLSSLWLLNLGLEANITESLSLLGPEPYDLGSNNMS